MFKSLRWRLQVWHAVVLLTVLSSFGAIVHRLHWQTRLQQIDAELHRTINLVYSQRFRLLPRPVRRPRRVDTPNETEAARTEQTAAGNTNAAPAPIPTEGEGEKSRPQFETNVRMARDQSQLPVEFDQLFHGEEDSRFYFVIWGKNGEMLQRSDLAPSIEYPNVHVLADGVPLRIPRDRKDKYLCREVVAAFPIPRMPGDKSPTSDLNILVGRSLEKDLAAQNQSGLLLALTGLVILAAGVLGGGWLAARAIRSIDAMTGAAEAISAQNLSQRINVKELDSELGKLAKVLNQTFDRLQSAFERQSQFTADASHELRTPLSVIATHTELALSRSRSNEDYRAALETCQRASQRMRSLIDALLLLARFEAGTSLLKHERVDIAALVQDCVELVEPLATNKSLSINCRVVPCQVKGDWDRLAQVVTNLLTNAIRYNADGGKIEATTRIERDRVVISVRDTGVGIAAAELPRIFDRFYQVDKVRGQAEGSCGLGLAICKTIVESHGGSISASSQPGVGTTMEVRLLLADATPVFEGAASSGELLVSTWEANEV